MKKKACIILAVITLLVLLFPMRYDIKDGGSVLYDAILYDVTRVHRIPMGIEKSGWDVGWEIEILGMTIYDHVEYVE